MRETVVVVAPAGRAQQDIRAGHLGAPLQVIGLLKPLGLLHRHGRRDHAECLVGREHAVPSGQRVAVQPAVTVVLREHLHHPALSAQLHIKNTGVLGECAVGDLEDRTQPVRIGLVRTEQPEVGWVLRVDVTHELTELTGRLQTLGGAGLVGHLHRVVVEVRQVQVHGEASAVGVRVGAHPLVTGGVVGQHQRAGRAVGFEQLVEIVRAHPPLEQPQMSGVLPHTRQRHLMSPPGALHDFAVHLVGAGPALR
ncbi:hypothetical protein SDC9_99880 [bioreactor metagenome]|uniref:Uncharacterized protein n=1 Tax=bioreactor metagenome TaxID=1076179 RepID=A0A645AJK3_9ZZZZ